MVRPRHTGPLRRYSRWLGFVSLVVLAAVIFAAIAFRFLPRDTRGDLVLDALRGGRPAVARLWVRLGADPNYGTGSGSALHIAAAAGDLEMLRFLIAHGAEVDRPAKWGVTPLHKAREYRQTEAERFLIAHGADANRVAQPQP